MRVRVPDVHENAQTGARPARHQKGDAWQRDVLVPRD